MTPPVRLPIARRMVARFETLVIEVLMDSIKTSARISRLVTVLATFSVLFLFVETATGQNAKSGQRVRVGQQVPDIEFKQALNHKGPLKLRELRGKVVLVERYCVM